MAPPRVLILGDADVGKHSLMTLITGHTAAKGQPSYLWTLDNKYYTAEVAMEPRRAGPGLAAGDYEAVLLVFDAARPASFATLQRWWEAQGDAANDVSIKLAVAAKADWLADTGSGAAEAAAARPGWLEDAQAWCAEQLVEYVEASTVAEQQQQQSADSGGYPPTLEKEDEVDEEGASGVARIVEALQANMWRGMQLKPAGSRGGASSGSADVHTSASRANGSADAGGGGAAAGAGGHEQPEFDFAAFLRGGTELPLETGAAGQPTANGTGGGDEDDGEVEAELQRMEALFAQIASTRERLQQLPDAERRQAAAAMVMQLVGALGLGDEEGEQEEGSSSEEEEEAAPVEPAVP